MRITRVVIVEHALAGVNPETLRYQERSTERVLQQEVVVVIYYLQSIKYLLTPLMHLAFLLQLVEASQMQPMQLSLDTRRWT